MDETTDIGRTPRGVGEERTAEAFSALIAGGGRPVSPTSTGAALADVTRRARRQHRRSLTGGAVVSVAAVGALVLAGPAALGASGLLADRGSSVSGQGTLDPAPEGGTQAEDTVAPLLSTAAVASYAPGAHLVGTPGNPRSPSDPGLLGVRGFCADAPLAGTTAPTQVWNAAWERTDDAAASSALRRVEERVLRWGDGADAGRRVAAYAWAMTDAPAACTGADEWEGIIPSEPVEGPIAGATMAPDATRTAWRYRVSAPSRDGRAVVELTVDVDTDDVHTAIQAVDPLLVDAVERASVAPTSGPGAVARGRAKLVNGPDQWRAPLTAASLLTTDEVSRVFPTVEVAAPAAKIAALPDAVTAGCSRAAAPDGVTPAASAWATAWTRDAGREVASIGEEVYRWDDPATAKGYVDAAQDPARACGGATSSDDSAWKAVKLRVADSAGTWWPVLARPVNGEPGRWTVRSVQVEHSTAVVITVTARASSPQDLADRVTELHYDADKRAVADQVVFP